MQAIVTGASRGLGLALTRALAGRGWRIVVDARDGAALERAVAGVEGVVAVAGDVADPDHRRRLVDAAGEPIDSWSTTRACSARARCRAGRLPARGAAPGLRGQRARSARARAARAPRLSRRRADPQRHAPTRRSSRTRPGADTARPRRRSRRSPPSSASRTRVFASTRSTRATCGHRCTRMRSPVRTSPTARRPRRAFPACSR